MELEDLIESIDIVDYISQYVDLQEKGSEWWGLSPFKDEKTPSFSVRREANNFYDFSSGIGGNVFTFVKHYNNCSSKEAVEILEKYAGCDGQTLAPRKKLAATIICKKFKPLRKNAKTSSATVFQENCMEKYEKRRDKMSVWEDEGISQESMDKFQVFYDSFSDRLVYPIRNIDGKIVNIGGRTLDPLWKEKKLRKYTYFASWGGGMNLIYGLFENMDEIKAKHEVILFEGCKSVLIANTWGIKNCGALLTSHLSDAQMKILAKLGCDVVFALDKEIRVRDDHNIEKLKQYVNVYYIWDRADYLNDKDSPVDRGQNIFMELYEQKLRYR